MIMTFSDELGIVSVSTSDDELGDAISFCDRHAYFSSDDRDYVISVDAVIQISRDSNRKEALCGPKE